MNPYIPLIQGQSYRLTKPVHPDADSPSILAGNVVTYKGPDYSNPQLHVFCHQQRLFTLPGNSLSKWLTPYPTSRDEATKFATDEAMQHMKDVTKGMPDEQTAIILMLQVQIIGQLAQGITMFQGIFPVGSTRDMAVKTVLELALNTHTRIMHYRDQIPTELQTEE